MTILKHTGALFVLVMFSILTLSACGVPLADVNQGEPLDRPYQYGNPLDRPYAIPGPGDEDFTKYLRCRKFLDETVGLRRKILIKQFEHFEAARKPETQAEAFELENELRDLVDQFYIMAPPDCVDVIPHY